VSDRFEIDSTEIEKVADRARTAGDVLLAALGRLAIVLDDHDECWGGDDIGRAFAEKYVNVADGTRANTEVMATNLKATGDFISDVAARFREVDDANAALLDRVAADQVEGWTRR
jgi:uncharacterized protein YukE